MTTAADVRVPILMYHEIAPPAETRSRLAVSPEKPDIHLVTANEPAEALAQSIAEDLVRRKMCELI